MYRLQRNIIEIRRGLQQFCHVDVRMLPRNPGSATLMHLQRDLTSNLDTHVMPFYGLLFNIEEQSCRA